MPNSTKKEGNTWTLGVVTVRPQAEVDSGYSASV